MSEFHSPGDVLTLRVRHNEDGFLAFLSDLLSSCALPRQQELGEMNTQAEQERFRRGRQVGEKGWVGVDAMHCDWKRLTQLEDDHMDSDKPLVGRGINLPRGRQDVRVHVRSFGSVHFLKPTHIISPVEARLSLPENIMISWQDQVFGMRMSSSEIMGPCHSVCSRTPSSVKDPWARVGMVCRASIFGISDVLTPMWIVHLPLACSLQGCHGVICDIVAGFGSSFFLRALAAERGKATVLTLFWRFEVVWSLLGHLT